MPFATTMRGRRREMERRRISIDMMSEHYDDMGLRIMMWPHLCHGPDRDPDEESDDDMPALVPLEAPSHTQWLHIRYYRQF